MNTFLHSVQMLLLLLSSLVFVQTLNAHVHNHQCKRGISGVEDNSGHRHKVDIVVTIKSGGHDSCEEETTTTTATPATVIQEQSTESFTCVKPGSFPNPDNCSDFFICHKNEVARGLERVKMSCPKGTAFDQKEKKCTAGAVVSCLLSNSDDLA